MRTRDEEKQLFLAKAITRVCIDERQIENILRDAQEFLGAERKDGHVLGITGSAAAGKSTLINKIIATLRKLAYTVVVLTIDPTDVKSGGSILADPMRMRDHYLDLGVFIRSFPSQGAPGALTPGIASVMKLARLFADFVIVETAGAGQGDVLLAALAHTFIALPDSRGDEVTLLKAGTHHHAHILVVNIRNNSPEDKMFLVLLLGIQPELKRYGNWETKIFAVDAFSGLGVETLVLDGILQHRMVLKSG